MENLHTKSQFEVCLDNIESADPFKRRYGVALLEKVGGSKALQVAGALINDSDPVVSSSAKRICAGLKKSGLMLRNFSQNLPLAEKQVVRGTRQILDEVVFIAKRNLNELMVSSFAISIPKLVVVSIIFAWPYLGDIVSDLFSLEVFALMIFVHQIFWKPFAWIGVSRAFLRGYPERTTRRISKALDDWSAYSRLLQQNLSNAFIFSMTLVATLYFYNKNQLGDFPHLMILVIWFGWWSLSINYIPVSILKMENNGFIDSINLRFKNFFPLSRISIAFVAVLAILYSIVFGSSVASLSALGVSLKSRPIDVNNNFGKLVIALWITADCFIEPFIICFRLLLTKLFIEGKRE